MESASAATDAAADALAKTEIAATTEPADAISPEAAARKGALDAWSVTLAEHDAAWAALQTEKKLGWESAAVDWHWKKRDAQFGHGGHSKVDRVNNRGMVPSTSKYVRFYREWMPKNHPTLFGGGDKSSSGDARAGADRKFADVGSSPGGMCEYLVGDLGWSGYAFSLAPEAAGFGMSFTSPRLGYADSDATAPREWQRMLELVGGPGSLDFVNGGVVIDRGQQKQEPSALSDVHVLEHVEIYKNEILLGLHALKAGGALYFAYQLGQTALLFRILLALRPAFGSVRVTPTFAVGRTPMYVFLADFKGRESPEAVAAAAFLQADTKGDGSWEAWHVSEWTAEVAALHAEMRESFELVWGSQTSYLKKQRLDAERDYEKAGGAAGADAALAAAASQDARDGWAGRQPPRRPRPPRWPRPPRPRRAHGRPRRAHFG